MPGVVFLSILSCFGPRRGVAACQRHRGRVDGVFETTPPRWRQRYVTPPRRRRCGCERVSTPSVDAGRQPRVRAHRFWDVLRDGLLHHPVHVLRHGVGGPGTDPRLQTRPRPPRDTLFNIERAADRDAPKIEARLDLGFPRRRPSRRRMQVPRTRRRRAC